jgi:uncharacterized protein
MIQCTSDKDAVVVPVRAQPGAARDRVAGEHDGALKVAVTAPPEDGRANAAITKALAKALGVRKSAVTLVSGQTSRNKTFRVVGVTAKQVQQLVT